MKKKRKTPVKVSRISPASIAGYLAVVLVLAAVVLYANRCLRRLPFFFVKDVTVRDGAAISPELARVFSYFKYRNIFTIDLEREARHIAALNPSYKKVSLVRFLPDHICVDIVKRKPVAVIQLQRGAFLVDDQCVVFDADGLKDGVSLPVISGFEKQGHAPVSGMRYQSAALKIALETISAVKSDSGLRNYRLDKVRVEDGNTISLIFSPQVAVKIGSDSIAEKIAILGTMVQQVGNNLDNIDYIDLRFREPVMKFKNTPQSQMS
jgi:cell division septal protein FtsQ